MGAEKTGESPGTVAPPQRMIVAETRVRGMLQLPTTLPPRRPHCYSPPRPRAGILSAPPAQSTFCDEAP